MRAARLLGFMALGLLGVAFALLTLGSRRLFPVFGLLTWAASPLALLLLVVVVAGLRRWRAVLVLLLRRGDRES